MFDRAKTISFIGYNISGLIPGEIKQKEYVKACKNSIMTWDFSAFLLIVGAGCGSIVLFVLNLFGIWVKTC